VSALDTLAGAATGQVFWKVATAVLAGLLLATGVAGGMAWWLTDRALTQTRTDLKAANTRADDYQAAIREQNRATEALAKAKVEADARGAAARAQAVEQGKRYDNALQQIAAARGTTCGDAMPAVNQLWESMR
jgi:ABC-type molybdate transport system substrate-binding protein